MRASKLIGLASNPSIGIRDIGYRYAKRFGYRPSSLVWVGSGWADRIPNTLPNTGESVDPIRLGEFIGPIPHDSTLFGVGPISVRIVNPEYSGMIDDADTLGLSEMLPRIGATYTPNTGEIIPNPPKLPKRKGSTKKNRKLTPKLSTSEGIPSWRAVWMKGSNTYIDQTKPWLGFVGDRVDIVGRFTSATLNVDGCPNPKHVGGILNNTRTRAWRDVWNTLYSAFGIVYASAIYQSIVSTIKRSDRNNYTHPILGDSFDDAIGFVISRVWAKFGSNPDPNTIQMPLVRMVVRRSFVDWGRRQIRQTRPINPNKYLTNRSGDVRVNSSLRAEYTRKGTTVRDNHEIIDRNLDSLSDTEYLVCRMVRNGSDIRTIADTIGVSYSRIQRMIVGLKNHPSFRSLEAA